MAMNWQTYILEARKRFPIVFEGHPSDFKVTRAKKSMIGSDFGQEY